MLINDLSLETLNVLLKNLSDSDIHFNNILAYNCVIKLKPREYIARFWDLDNKPYMNGFGGNIMNIEDTCQYDNGNSYSYASHLKELY